MTSSLLRSTVTILLITSCMNGPKAQEGRGAGNVTISTDHPVYPGEGRFQTVDDCVEFATADATASADRALAMYRWFLQHQWHLMSPMEWCVPDRVPDSQVPGDYETVVFDANRGRFSYGYGLCGTVHAWNEVYWRALGMQARRREFPNHVNSEVFHDAGWRAYDTDMAGLVLRHDGSVAGYDDIREDLSLLENRRPGLPQYPFAWPQDSETMKDGWKEVARRKNWYCLYNGGYAAHPGIVFLRRGESFTRWFRRDHFGGPDKRRFWQNQSGGPQRSWSYFGTATPHHDGSKHNARNLATYCNAEFVYSPDLSETDILSDVATASSNLTAANGGLASKDGKTAFVTFRHFSPYVICGDPQDDANPMSGHATDGLVIDLKSNGKVRCEVSPDEGQTWQTLQLIPHSDSADRHAWSADATDVVKGRYGWQVKLTLAESSFLHSVSFTTVCQASQAMYPRLSDNGCAVVYRTDRSGVVATLPNFGLPESQVDFFEARAFRSKNLRYAPRKNGNRFAYLATDTKPAAVVFKVNAPNRLKRVSAAFRYQVPVPPTPGCECYLDVSTDNGRTWSVFAAADIPTDNEFSSGWLAGSADLPRNLSQIALVRCRMSTPGRRAALIDAQFYGVYETPPPQEIQLEFGWDEDGVARNWSKTVDTPTFEQFTVPTGMNVSERFVRISAGQRAALALESADQ